MMRLPHAPRASRHQRGRYRGTEAAPWVRFCWIVANRLLSALVDIEDVARGQGLGECDSRLGDVPHGLHIAPVWMSQARGPDIHLPSPPWQVSVSSM